MSSGFNVIRKHARDAASIRIKELAQQLAKQRTQANSSQLETDDIRSQGRMDHSTIKLNDERLKFGTTLPASNLDYYYEFPSEPDFDKLKVWFMLDHLGTRMRDTSGFNNDAIIVGHPTLRRVSLDLGFQQQGSAPATPAMLFNSGTDTVSQVNGEYIWIPDNPSIRFTEFNTGFSIAFRFNCLEFRNHTPLNGSGSSTRRFASKSEAVTFDDDDEAIVKNGWNIVVNANTDGSNRGMIFQVLDNGINYQKRATGFNTNTWYQVVVTYDKSLPEADQDRVKIYVGGNITGSANTSALFFSTHPNLRIGARDSISGFFYGYLNDFRLWMGKVMTQQEITNLNDNEVSIDDIPKGHHFIVQYALVTQAQRFAEHKYHITGKVIRKKRHRFGILQRVARSLTHKFTLLNKVTTTKTHKFNLLQKVVRSPIHRYQMGGIVRAEKTHKYNIIEKLVVSKTHRYSIGGLQTEYKRFQKSTTAGSNITQDVTFAAKPQALIVWSNNSTTDAAYTSHYHMYYGFSDGTNHASIQAVSTDSVGTSDTFGGLRNDKVISMMSESAQGTSIANATVSFVSPNIARFNWATNDNRAVYIHCMAIYGIGNAEVKTFTNGTTSTGTRTFSLENANMLPTFLHAISASTSANWAVNNGLGISIGAATSSAKQFAMMNVSEDNEGSSDTWTGYYNHSVIYGTDADDGSEDFRAVLSSFNRGSFTLDIRNQPSVTTRAFSVLVLDAPTIDIGIITQPDDVLGNQVINTAANVGPTRGLMMFTNNETSGSRTSDNRLVIGGASGTGSTQQGLVASGDDDSKETTDTVTQTKTGSVTKAFTISAIAENSETDSEASVNALGSVNNQFRLNWTTIDSTARKYWYIVFGGQ